MLVTGAGYALVGIKNQHVHTFLSTAYLVALGVAVLIVYVMSLPVSNALQGGYVAAAVLSGCTVGVASVFFKELTEGLGCALGGFCVSMWLLTLVDGGLLTSVASKAIFIACFTVVAFLFYFSRWTRDWALIVMISFAGATISVLGIDCFSRAGMKEFWAYIWELNKNMFPLGTDTFPVTKGIRVESAAIIIISLIGVISQIKLWRIVREKKQKRAAARAEDERNLHQEEEDLGRQIEETTARERRQWERAYGDGDIGSSTIDSEVGEGSSEKNLRNSHNDSTTRHSQVEVIEMAQMSDPDQTQSVPDPLMTAAHDAAGKITVRVAADDYPSARPSIDRQTIDKPQSVAGSELKSRVGSVEHKSQSQQVASAAPDIVPLPFTIPQEDDRHSLAERSSIATFADEEEGVLTQSPRRRSSLKKRFSQSSQFLRSMSPRSGLRSPEHRQSLGGSEEDLIIPKDRHPDDDEKSIAATFDGESVGAIDQLSMSGFDVRRQSVTKENSEQVDCEHPKLLTAEPSKDIEKSARPISTDTAATLNADNWEATPNAKSEVTEVDNVATPASRSRSGEPETASGKHTGGAKSVASVASSRASLTKERLPPSLSRVALSYRTNEWTKHLSQAEAPELEELQVGQLSRTSNESIAKEHPMPVDFEGLQKGVEEGALPPALPRSESRASIGSTTLRQPSKRDSRQINATPTSPVLNGHDREGQQFVPANFNPAMGRSTSMSALRRTSSTFEPIAEEQNLPFHVYAIPEEHGNLRPTSTNPSIGFNDINRQRSPVPGVVSYNSPQTLIGQREMFLRSKSQGNLLATTPESNFDTYGAASDTGSLANYPMYAASLVDPDDVPLSQRKQMMRHNSLASLQGVQPGIRRQSSGFDLPENQAFDSHQPKRGSTLPTPAAREAQLAQFRNSVANELRAGTPMMAQSTRETPFSSTTNALAGRDTEVKRNIDYQRSMMMGQKEAEAQRKEWSRQEKEWADRAFDERMRSGELMGAHREAIRRMQQNAKN
jgi:hypothetical protein